MAEDASYELVVIGATPGGLGAAIRGAREGLDTCIVSYHAHVGGMMSGGLSVTDTLIDHRRARSPILNEFFSRVTQYYAESYGDDSTQVKHCRDGLYFEPKVAEAVFEDMLKTANIDRYQEYYPKSVSRSNRRIRSVELEPIPTRGSASEPIIKLRGDTFIDATYEGDLAATAGVPYRIGREGRDDFGEQYAGRLFSEKGTRIYPGSSGFGDRAVQSYDYRLCLSKDPDNRRLPDQPPGYDRAEFAPILEDAPDDRAGELPSHQLPEIACKLKSELVVPTREEIDEQGLLSLLLLRGPLPNQKRDLNTADLPGEADEYPEANWHRREEIAKRHEDHVLGLLYFLQNDDAVPDKWQAEIREWGLPLDEFTDNDGFPFQLYVREARRIIGRTTFTEHDARLAEGIERAPIHNDSIAIAEYAMDSHDCRPVRRPGSLNDGHHYLGEITVPSQVPYRSLLPTDIDNLLVPVALSATHVGFGTIRLEPTWLQIGEAAGWAAALASNRGTMVAELAPDVLQRRLVANDTMISYFDDIDPDDDHRGSHAAQYFGTKGFFRGYDASLESDVDTATVARWASYVTDSVEAVPSDRTDRARDISPETIGDPITFTELSAILEKHFDQDRVSTVVQDVDFDLTDTVSRGVAMELLFRLHARN